MKAFTLEDVPQTCQELIELLAAVKGLEAIGQAGSVREALKGIEATAPEAVTLDISLPDGSGIEVLKHIRRRGWDLCVVVLTGNLMRGCRPNGSSLGPRRSWRNSTGWPEQRGCCWRRDLVRKRVRRKSSSSL
jgi:DNA-binding NarL/FixJ family response regulator